MRKTANPSPDAVKGGRQGRGKESCKKRDPYSCARHRPTGEAVGEEPDEAIGAEQDADHEGLESEVFVNRWQDGIEQRIPEDRCRDSN